MGDIKTRQMVDYEVSAQVHEATTIIPRSFWDYIEWREAMEEKLRWSRRKRLAIYLVDKQTKEDEHHWRKMDISYQDGCV